MGWLYSDSTWAWCVCFVEQPILTPHRQHLLQTVDHLHILTMAAHSQGRECPGLVLLLIHSCRCRELTGPTSRAWSQVGALRRFQSCHTRGQLGGLQAGSPVVGV